MADRLPLARGWGAGRSLVAGSSVAGVGVAEARLGSVGGAVSSVVVKCCLWLCGEHLWVVCGSVWIVGYGESPRPGHPEEAGSILRGGPPRRFSVRG